MGIFPANKGKLICRKQYKQIYPTAPQTIS